MVMVFPLGKLLSWDSPLGERVGCMITPRWGRGWVSCYVSLGEGGLLGYSPLGERVGCLVIPAGGETGFTICKANSCFVCSVVVLDFYG